MTEQYLKGDQIAAYLSISRAHAYSLMRKGRIPTLKIGRSRRVSFSDLETFIKTNTVIETNAATTINTILLKTNEG